MEANSWVYFAVPKLTTGRLDPKASQSLLDFTLMTTVQRLNIFVPHQVKCKELLATTDQFRTSKQMDHSSIRPYLLRLGNGGFNSHRLTIIAQQKIMKYVF